VVRKGNSICVANSDAIERLKLSAGDNHSYYISESELQIHVVPIPVWPRSAILLLIYCHSIPNLSFLFDFHLRMIITIVY
jgi:hypothetical protein